MCFFGLADIVLEALAGKAIEQVPALVVFTVLCFFFLKHMTSRDKLFLEHFKDINQEMHTLTETLSTLCVSVRESHGASCNFHDAFVGQLDRIERAVVEKCDP